MDMDMEMEIDIELKVPSQRVLSFLVSLFYALFIYAVYSYFPQSLVLTLFLALPLALLY